MSTMKVNLSAIGKIAQRMDSASLKEQIARIPQEREIAALIGQSIADNFDKEGPGWQPLKPSTIRYSIAKGIRKQLERATLKSMGLKSRRGMSMPQRSKFKEGMEKKVTEKNDKGEKHRMILQKTRLLYKTATIPGYAGSNKSAAGSNIYRVNRGHIVWGTNLKYAAIHQEGDPSKGVPARPFLVIRPEWWRKIETFMSTGIIETIRRNVMGSA